MKAAVLEKVGAGFSVQDLRIDNPAPHEVLVDVGASGLCHSDLHVAEVDFGMPMPIVLGHEVAGRVAAIGSEVRDIAVGDTVVASLLNFCGHCARCLSGRSWQCLNRQDAARAGDQPPRLSRNGEPVHQFERVGGFAEQVLVHEHNLVSIDPAVPLDRACLLGCAVLTGMGAVLNSAEVRPGQTVAVIGCGGVGLNAVQAARIAGASRVIAIDLAPEKLELARTFGATDVVNPRDGDPVAAVQELTSGGVDHAFEVIGLSSTAAQAVRMLTLGGDAYLVGMPRPGTTLDLDVMMDLWGPQRSLHNVFMGSGNLRNDVRLYAQLYLQGRLNLDDLIAARIGLNGIDEGYEALKKGATARSVVTFS